MDTTTGTQHSTISGALYVGRVQTIGATEDGIGKLEVAPWRDERVDIVASIGRALTAQKVGMAIKTDEDLLRYQAVIDKLRPAVVVETGTAKGGSALWFAETAHCAVITVDIDPDVPHAIWQQWNHRVDLVCGNSADQRTAAKVIERVGGREPVLVTLDSDHSAAHVAAELELYAPLVSVGSYLVVEDTLVRWMPWYGYKGSPYDAVDAFCGLHGDFANDEAVESMFNTSQHPGGWLQRIA